MQTSFAPRGMRETSIVNGSRKTITRYLPYGRYDKFNEHQGLRPATICWLQIRRNGAMLRVTYCCWYCRMCNLSAFTFHLSVHLICPSRRSLPEVFTFHLWPFTFQISVLYTQKSDIRGEFVKKNGKKLTNIQKLIIFATARWGIPLKETIHKNGATPIFIGIL